MIEVVQKGHVALSTIAREVPLVDIGSPKLNTVLANMREALDACDDGVALAAPQIGETLRIFIVHPRAWKQVPSGEHLVYINPTILKRSKKKEEMDEGCLSVRGIYGKTKRSPRATVEAYDEHGKKFTRGAGGLLAQIFQHETDHLNGILFVDHATDLVRQTAEKDGETASQNAKIKSQN